LSLYPATLSRRYMIRRRRDDFDERTSWRSSRQQPPPLHLDVAKGGFSEN
jgi:hypothetical protein